jgi:ribosomal-protein-alanine N-acetyltransferase
VADARETNDCRTAVAVIPPVPLGAPVTTVQPAERHATIRQATRADLLDVFRIEKDVFEQPWPYSAFERLVGQSGFLVSERAGGADALGTITGYVVADTIPNHGRPLGHIKDIAVAPEFRGQGVGESLLRRGLQELSRQGARSVKLEVRRGNEAAINLYEKYDFEYLRTLPKYYTDGEDAYVFVTNLESQSVPLGDRDGF